MLIDTQFSERNGALRMVGLARDLGAGRGAKSVEYRFFEVLFSEPVPGGIREGVGLCCGDEGDGAAAEARAGEPRAQSAGLARGLDEGVELGGRDLEIVAHGEVGVVHEAAEGREIFLPQRPDRFEDPGVLKDNVASALELFALEPVQVLLFGVSKLPYAQIAGGVLAGLPAVLVAGIGEATLNAGVADEEGEARFFEIERYGFGLQAAAVYEEGGSGVTEQGSVLVHNAGRYADEVVLGPLTENSEVFFREIQPEERVEGKGGCCLDRRARREPGAERHIPCKGRAERRHLRPVVPHRPEDASRVISPGAVCSFAEGRPLGEVGRE